MKNIEKHSTFLFMPFGNNKNINLDELYVFYDVPIAHYSKIFEITKKRVSF